MGSPVVNLGTEEGNSHLFPDYLNPYQEDTILITHYLFQKNSCQT